MSIFKQGMFQVDPNSTPDQIAQKRAMIAALMPRFGSAKYVGEGLGQLATGVAIGKQNRQLDKIEGAGNATAKSLRDRVFGTARSATDPAVTGPLSVLGMKPEYASPDSSRAVSGASVAPVAPIAPKTANPGGLPESVISAVDKVAPLPAPPQAEAFNFAAKNIGLNERDQGAALQEFMANGGVNLDPAVTAWCAAYVNAALGQAGIEGTGSNMARSFLEWGQGVDQPTRGDIGVLPRGNPDGPYGHVGFVDGVNEDGTIRLLGGNQGDAVSVQNYPADAFLGFRRAGEGGAPAGAAPAPTSAPQIPVNELYAMLSDPWQPPEVKQLVQSMIAEQQQASDPLRQLQLQKAQMEVDQMGAPAGPPEDLVERQALAAAGGLQPGTPEYQTYLLTGQLPEPPEPGYTTMSAEEVKALGLPPGSYQRGPKGEIKQIGGGGQTIKIDMGADAGQYLYGTDGGVPAGWRVHRETGVASQIPGGPAAVEAESTAAAADRRSNAKSAEADVIISAASRAREAAGKRNLGPFGTKTVGSLFPQSDSGEVVRQVATLKSNGTFSALQQMRDNSQTGAAMGAASDADLRLLAEKAGALDPESQNFVRDLDDYERTLLRTLYGPEEGDRVFEESRSGAKAPPKATPGQRLKFNPATGELE